MVHGNYYSIQYEIFLNKPIDFFDDLLPIWVSTRARIEMETDKNTGQHKLIIIPYKEFDKQLYSNSLFNSYISEVDNLSYTRKEYTEDETRGFKFLMVSYYKKYIKHNPNLYEPITKDEYKQLLDTWRECKKIDWGNVDNNYKELSTHYKSISHQLIIQRIIHDKEYFEEIKGLEKKLIEQVSLSEQQIELVKNVLDHPKLHDLVSWHGLNLIDGYY